MSRSGFVPISIPDFVRLHCERYPKEKVEIETQLRRALAAARAGERCSCGNPIWVIGSAVVGHACFTCITGEANPDQDYEITEAMKFHVPSFKHP